MMHKKEMVLVTGVTGYIGGRLVPELLDAGYDVRVLVRGGAERLAGRDWADRVEVVTGNVLEPETLPEAVAGITAVYYLIHSMGQGEAFRQRDKQAARNLAAAAASAGVERIIYLGGLGHGEDLSDHLKSRQETGDALREAGVPVTEFRAAVVVGSGSVSFEMVRHLTERVPLLICPRWVRVRIQPIAVRDLLAYLVAALATPASTDEIIEVGGADVLTYGDMMLGYAAERGLRRKLLPVPLLTPLLSSYWVHLVTPISAAIAQPLIKGLRNEVVVMDDKAQRLFPDIVPVGYETAVREALERIRAGEVETVWSDIADDVEDAPTVFTQEQGMFIERRAKSINAPPAAVYRAFTSLGGEYGWPPYDWLWKIRGLLDQLVGGVGVRRGRRHPAELRTGDALDFWRVEALEPNKSLLLRAEMKVPGRAWLHFEAIENEENGRTDFVQTAYFASKGLLGLLYWYSLLPLHVLIFPGLVADIARRAEAEFAATSEHREALSP